MPPTQEARINAIDPRAPWYVLRGGKQSGPISIETLRDELVAGRLNGSDYAWTPSQTQWVRVNEALAGHMAEYAPSATARDSAAAKRGGTPAGNGKASSAPSAAQSAEHSVRRTKSAALYVVLTLVLVALSISSCLQFLAEGKTTPLLYAVKGEDRRNALMLSMQVVETDLLRGSMRFNVTPRVDGTLSEGSARVPSRNIELSVTGMRGPQSIAFPKERNLEPFDIDVALSDGDILLYPMDTYRSWIEVETWSDAPDGSQRARVPTVIELVAHNHAMHASARLSEQSSSGDVAIEVGLARLMPIVAFTWFMAGVAGMVALTVMLMVLSVVTGRRKADLGMLGWTAALLFALPSVRNSLPGAPPLGAFIDYAVFFWAEALVGVSMLVLVPLWFTARERPN